MRWDDFRRSDNVEDAGGESGGGGFGLPVGGGGLGIGTVVVLGLIGWALGIDPSILISGAEIATGGRTQQQQPYNQEARRTAPQNDKMRDFIAAVLGNTEDVWSGVFKEAGQTYQAPKLRRFYGTVQAKCGMASAASGPFYCPVDRHIYIDTSFFNELEVRFRGCTGKACEFAQAYVIAHEVGHHVQNLLGILPKAQSAQRAAGNKAEANRIQVRV